MSYFLQEPDSFPDIYDGNRLLVNHVTLLTIKEKAKAGKYINFSDYQLDFKWLTHNCIVLRNLEKGKTVSNRSIIYN